MGSSQSSSTSRSTGTTDDVLASNGEGSMVPPPPRDDNLTSQHNHNNSKNEDNHSNNKLQSISLLVDDERKKKKKKDLPPHPISLDFTLFNTNAEKRKRPMIFAIRINIRHLSVGSSCVTMKLQMTYPVRNFLTLTKNAFIKECTKIEKGGVCHDPKRKVHLECLWMIIHDATDR
jgi:hypothetical protein